MRTHCLVVVASLVFLSLVSWADTFTAASCSYGDVAKAIADASSGDMVIVPEGTATWSSTLSITKGIQLRGAGAEKTVITGNVSGYLISYRPADYSANHPFGVSGFTFDGNGSGTCIILNYSTTNTTIQTKIRIDHNVFNHFGDQALVNNGMRGVVDNNVFTNTNYPIRHESGANYGKLWWDNWQGIIYGAADNNMYYEDNTIHCKDVLVNSQQGNRYLFRYNDITATGDSYPLMDMHGDDDRDADPNTCAYWSTFGGEIYANNITMVEGQVLDQRGGKVLVFLNNVNGTTVGIKLRDEFCEGYPCVTTNPQPQHISDSYYWNNRIGYSGQQWDVYEGGISDCGSKIVAQDRDYFVYDPLFDGTAGVGCGPLSSRPGTCTVGAGYWATDQDVSNIRNYVGRNPSVPISGVFYKCTVPNTWTVYYTPYTYPHPLRAETVVTPTPNSPTGLRLK